MKRWLAGLLPVAVLAVLTTPLVGQAPLPVGNGINWEELSQPARVIFAGTVLRIERVTTNDGEPATVQVSFRVDKAVRGCDAGQTILLEEWAELWVDQNRYREGQRVLIFLYPRSDTGLSSPVAGDLGKINIGPQDLLQFTPQQVRFLSSQTAMTGSQSDAQSSHSESQDSVHVRLRSWFREEASFGDDEARE